MSNRNQGEGKTVLPHNCRQVDVSEYGTTYPDENGKWFLCNDLHSDPYNQNSCALSNSRVFGKDFANGEDSWWRWVGPSIAIRTLAYRNYSALREVIDRLCDYPLLDESDHSDLEQELQQESWESWGRSDFRRELVRVLKTHLEEHGVTRFFSVYDSRCDNNSLDADQIIERLTDEQVDVLFWEGCCDIEQYPEGSSDISFPLVDVADAWNGFAPSFDENGEVAWRESRTLADYPAFALNPACSRCGDIKIVGECHEHIDCCEHDNLALRQACPNALKAFKSMWSHDCEDPECAAVFEARRLDAEKEARKPDAQLGMFGDVDSGAV